ncbi:MAG: aminopeptidase, partial [Sphaerochaeta sp.]
MSDQRELKLARLLVTYSVDLQKGESCLINAVDIPVTMTEALIKAVYEVGGYPVVNVWSQRLERAMCQSASQP